MELKELIVVLNKLPDLEGKIKYIENLLSKEKNPGKKAEFEIVLKRLREIQKVSEKDKKESGKEKPKAQLRLEDIIIPGAVRSPDINLDFREDYKRETGTPPRIPLTALTEQPRDRLKEDYVQVKEYIERKAPATEPNQTYARMETPEYIERQNIEQGRAFRPVEEQQTFEGQFVGLPRAELSQEEYKKQEIVKEMMKDKELIKEEYLREKRRRGLA